MTNLRLLLAMLPATLLGLSGCKTNHTATVAETSYMNTYPGAYKGDLLIFNISPTSPGSPVWVHFPLASPCDEKDISGTADSPPQCAVTANVTEAIGQYPFYSDSTAPRSVVEENKSICGGCCHSCKFIIINPKPKHPLIHMGFGTSGHYPAEEILIDETQDGSITADPASAYTGQPVTWFRAGTTDISWTIAFDDPTACSEKKPIGSGIIQSQICTVAGTVDKSPYTYTMTVGKRSGKGLLYVTKPISLASSK